MLPLTNTFDLNERLFVAIDRGSYENVLKCLMEGARATKISVSCGRTAVGQAALLGDAEILELLLQSCEEPEMDMFQNGCHLNLSEMDIDTTPDGMDKLEWDDEFDCECENNNSAPSAAEDGTTDDCTSLYLYYAKTFERTGHILTTMEEANMTNCGRATQDPHTLDALSMSPLHYASACGHLDSMRILLEHGAQVDVATSDGLTPLHAAAAENDDVVRLLLKHKANPNRKTFSSGETPLHVAMRHCNTAVINLLLLSTVNINEPDNHDQTPLMLAIAHALDDIAVRLIDMGAKLNLEDSAENTALYLAVTQNNVAIATHLLAKGARLMIAHYLLHYCVKHNYVRMAELLIEHGENLNVRDMFGISATMLAIMYKNAEMLECLLQAAAKQRLRGRQIDHVENGLLTAVQYAPEVRQFKALARVLFAYDEVVWHQFTGGGGGGGGSGDVDVAGMSTSSSCCVPYCATPLSRAIMLYKMDIAEMLIKEGADIAQICREHIVNTLRLGLHRGFVTLSILLVHAGFKFPALPLHSPFKTNWRTHRIHLETVMRQLNRSPLSLQSLARIQIRQQLIRNLKTTSANVALMATKQASALSRVIAVLEIPKPLQKFLYDFDDLRRVSNCSSD